MNPRLANPRFTLIAVILGVLFSVFSFSLAHATEEPVKGDGPFNLTIFHTNDAHSYFLPRPAVWRDDGRMVGGVIPLAWHLEKQRADCSADLLLDAGDFMTGNPVCQFQPHGVPGEAVARMMNLLNYDCGTIGNHEFDIGAENVKRLIPLFDYPLIAADIVDEDAQKVFRSEPLIVERGGLKIGIMGVSCAEMSGVVTASRFGGLKSIDQGWVLQRQAVQLDPKVDLMVVITHNGFDGDVELAQVLAGTGVDVIVGGHSHSRLKEPHLEEGILIVQAGSKWTNLGRLDLQVADDRVVAYNGRLITLWADGAEAGPELTKLVEGYEKKVADEFGRTIGTLVTDWRKGRGESNLGNFLADQMRLSAKADVGLVNSGGIRKSMNAGPITALDINEMLPFSNMLVTARLTGRELKTVVQANADAQVEGKHGILQVSGLSYRFRTNSAGNAAVVEEILVGGKPLDSEKVYTVAMPDYVVMMAHVYLNIDTPATEDVGLTMTDAVVAGVEKTVAIDSKIEGRIMRLDSK